MTIVRARTALCAIALTAIATSLSGCGSSLVSRNESLNTFLGDAPERTSYRVGPEVDRSDPRVIVIPGDSFSSTDSGAVGASAGRPVVVMPAGVSSGAQALNAEQQRFIGSVNDEVNALRARMLEIASRANIKGAAGNAALEPHQRVFNDRVEKIQMHIDDATDMRADSWTAFETDVNAVLAQARQEVEMAARDVDAVPTVN